MPIYEKNGVRILHAHIPKTGGTSITMMAIDNGWKVEKCLTSHKGFPTYMKPDGSTPMQHATKYVYREWEYDVSFAVVRDPVERMRSELAQRCITANAAHEWISRQFYIHRILTEGRSQEELATMEINKWPAPIGWHIHAQSDYVDDDCIWMRYGHEDDALCRILGDEPRRRLRCAKKEKPEIGMETIEMIREFYLEDYNRFYKDV